VNTSSPTSLGFAQTRNLRLAITDCMLNQNQICTRLLLVLFWMMWMITSSVSQWHLVRQGRGKQGGGCGVSDVGLVKRKEEAMTGVMDSSMTTEKFVLAMKQCQGKHTEKMQLKEERDTTSYYVSVCFLPESSANGNSAHGFMNSSKIESTTASIEQITKWFDGNPSPKTAEPPIIKDPRSEYL
jgi:hypothetical protein